MNDKIFVIRFCLAEEYSAYVKADDIANIQMHIRDVINEANLKDLENLEISFLYMDKEEFASIPKIDDIDWGIEEKYNAIPDYQEAVD